MSAFHCPACRQALPDQRRIVIALAGHGEVIYDGERRTLTPQQYRLFARLAQGEGGVVEISQLIAALWSDDPQGGPLDAIGILRVLVHDLRERFGGGVVNSHYGRGYSLGLVRP